MWTKDYLVRGLVKRRRGKRERLFWYEQRSWLRGDAVWTAVDEWQALYRVEDARRRLRAARQKAEEQRQLVLSMDAQFVREAVTQAQWDAGFARRQEEQRRLRAQRAAERKAKRVLAPLKERQKASRERTRQILEWRGQGWTYRRIGQELGLSFGRVQQIDRKEKRRREAAPKRNWPWYLNRMNLGRPLDIDANRENYRGKWLYDEC